MIRVALVDDHRVVVRSLQAYLQSFPDLAVVGVASSGEELLTHVDEWNPDVILQDLLLPGGLDGVRTTEQLMTGRPQSRVVALTASVDEARMMGVLRAGAAGYVRKDADPETLVAAIRAVAAGKTFIDPAVSQMLSERPAPDDLTQRELDVLREVALGHTNRDIAVTLGVTHETVKTHVARVLGKLQVENRAQAIVQALKRGLVTLEEIS